MNKDRYKSGKCLAVAITVSFCLLIFTMFSRAGVSMMGLSFVGKIQDGRGVTKEEGQKIDDMEQSVVRVMSAVQLLTCILFIVWMRRAHKNLRHLGAKDVKSSTHSCIWGWMVPIICLAKPVMNMQEIWKASDPAELDDVAWKAGKSSKLIWFWWSFWILFCVLGAFSKVFLDVANRTPTPDLGALGSFYFVTLVTQPVSLNAAILAIAVVIRLTRRQDAKLERVSENEDAEGLEEEPASETDAGRRGRDDTGEDGDNNQ